MWTKPQKKYLDDLEGRLNTKIDDVKTELKQDINDLRIELKGDINELKELIISLHK